MSKIVIISDLQHRPQRALERGLVLANELGLAVEVVAFCYEYLDEVPDESREQARKLIIDNKRRWLETELKTHEPVAAPLSSQIVWEKSLYEWINHYCQERDIYAVVKTAHRSATFIYTSTDWHLLRSCPAPVLLVAENKWRRSRPILAALDLATDKADKRALNQKIIEKSVALAKVLNTEVHVIHVITLSAFLRDLDIIDVDIHTTERIKALEPVVAQWSSRYGIAREHFYLKHGYPYKVIPSIAHKIKADLVVIGTVGRQGISGKLIGNTAEQVLEHLQTDVLTIKA